MIPKINKLVVSVITKLAPYVSPLCPPKDLFIKFGIKIEVIKPDKMQYINIKILDKLLLVKNRKSIIPIEVNTNDGLISQCIPFQW